MPNQIAQGQFQIVTDLLKRQDEALEQLDELSARVEKAIDELIDNRESSSETNADETNADENGNSDQSQAKPDIKPGIAA